MTCLYTVPVYSAALKAGNVALRLVHSAAWVMTCLYTVLVYSATLKAGTVALRLVHSAA
jgi:hypothetical protein